MEKEKKLLNEKNMNDVSGGWWYNNLADAYFFNRAEVSYLRNSGYIVDAPIDIPARVDEEQGRYQNVAVLDANGKRLSYNKVRNLLINGGFAEE